MPDAPRIALSRIIDHPADAVKLFCEQSSIATVLCKSASFLMQVRPLRRTVEFFGTLRVFSSTLEVFFRTLRVFRGTPGVFRRSLGVFRRTLEVFRRTLEVFRRTLEVFRRTLEVFRRTLEVFRRSLSPLKRTLPTITKYTPSLAGCQPKRRVNRDEHAKYSLRQPNGSEDHAECVAAKAEDGLTMPYPPGQLTSSLQSPAPRLVTRQIARPGLS